MRTLNALSSKNKAIIIGTHNHQMSGFNSVIVFSAFEKNHH
ncbi:hypothetical protein PMAN_a0600 [Pseudoalteromonas marina]|nr:hypothetical protein PMAN_a0600 [Pseudoalteromonas marina]